MKNKKWLFCLLVTIITLPNLLQAASVQPDSIDLGVSVKLSMMLNPRGGTNYSVSAAFRASSVLTSDIERRQTDVTPFWQVAVNFYNRGLGTSLLPKRRKAQIDVVNSVGTTFGFGRMPEVRDMYIVRPFNFMTASAISQETYMGSLSLGSNFIINNHGRNQQVGFMDVGIHRYVQLSYYNDGPPFHWIALADGYDRWWTGGAALVVKVPSDTKINGWPENTLDAATSHQFYYVYDRFTGDVQDAYILANQLALGDVPSADVYQNFYNNGQTIFGYRHPRGLGIGLTYTGPRPKFDIQDIIHDINGSAHHPSLANKHWYTRVDFSRFLFDESFNLPK